MKFRFLAMLLASGVCLGGAAFAQSADDQKWITQCLSDNQEAKASVSVVATYCNCMNNKMSDNETRSITEWEKANPNARRVCERESGWN